MTTCDGVWRGLTGDDEQLRHENATTQANEWWELRGMRNAVIVREIVLEQATMRPRDLFTAV